MNSTNKMDKASDPTMTTVSSVPASLVDDSIILDEKTGTAKDAYDMHRMGKEQLFRRGFSFFTMFGFTAILLNTWEAMLGLAAFGLLNGGTAGMLYMFIVVGFLFFLVVLSMAELASMAPTAGGQYHWVSEFAPRKVQKQVSYLIGWLCVLGWQTGGAAACYLAGTAIQGLIVLNHEDSYVPKRWHGSLMAMATACGVGLFNSFLAQYLPVVEGLVLILHFCGFFGIMVPLWVLGKPASSEQVWTTFLDGGNWGSTGVACLVGSITPIVALLGADCAVHMAEEIRHASRTLPPVMVGSYLLNAILGFIMLITFCYNLGNLEDILATPTGYPYIQVFYNVTQSKAAATGMACIPIILAVANAMTNVAASSRQLFAFARDKGVPFHGFFQHVPVGYDVPTNAIAFTVLFACILHSINIASAIGFNQILSLGTCALLCSYVICIGCIALRRARDQELLPSKFSLGRFGLPINILSILFAAYAFVFSLFPPETNPPLETMNWASVIFSGVLTLSGVYYFLHARHHYDGPVEYVRKLE